MLAPLVWRLPLERLKAIAAQVGAPEPSKAEAKLPAEWASNIRDQFADPNELREWLTADDLRIIGESYTFGTRASWEATHPGESFDAMVLELVFQCATQKKTAAAPKLRAKSTKAAHVEGWPELATSKALGTADAKSLAAALAASFGAGFEPIVRGGQGAPARPGVLERTSGITYVVVPGGKAHIGLAATEKKKLAPVAKRLGEEAMMHLATLAEIAAPARAVATGAFLCAEAPLTKTQATALGAKIADVTPVHDIALLDAKIAAKAVARAKGRLLSEAEWEYVARGGDGRAWLSGDEDPAAFVRARLRGKLLAGDAPFGVFGLMWGTWVDDGWFDSHKGAPADGTAREPRRVPEVMRGGGAPMLVPWQIGGEAMLLLTAHRERRQKGSVPVLLALDLPTRAR